MSPIEFRLLPDSATVGTDGVLNVGGCSLLDLAGRFGTPLFVYDVGHIRARCREAVAAFGEGRVIYATKAFLCRAVARLVYEEGLLFDVASGGELHVVLASGVPAEACVMHGNNKSIDELRLAITSGVRRIVVDSFDELDRLDGLHREGLPVPDVLLRVTPGVHAHTHTYIATGQNDSKFGFNLANGDAEQAAQRAQRSPSVNLVGFHCHIGSNVFVADSFAKAATVMAEFAASFDLPELVLGGGLGVAYVADESAPSTSDWATAVIDACASTGLRAEISVEPGRALVAGAGAHAVHGRHDQADPRCAHLRGSRWRDERQSTTRAVRQRLRGDAAAQPARRPVAPGTSRRQAL